MAQGFYWFCNIKLNNMVANALIPMVANALIPVEIPAKVCYTLICIIVCSKWEVTGNGDQLQETLETAHR